MYTIKDLAEGRCAVKNDGTLDELREVIRKAFPESNYQLLGQMTYYKSSKTKGEWVGINYIQDELPTQSVKKFLQLEFKRGEIVLVTDDINSNWNNRIYLTTIPELAYPYVCVEGGQEKKYKAGTCRATTSWKYIQKTEEEKVELTLEDISEKTGIPVHLIRIKD